MTPRSKAGTLNLKWSRVVTDSTSLAELADRLWPAVSAELAGPITPAELGSAARLTTGSAQSLLAEWADAGRLDRRVRLGKHGPYDDRYALPGTFVRVLVTGSRTWDDAGTLNSALHDLAAEHGPRLVIVHGACPRGADALADDWCRRSGTPAERHPADWSAGPGAGPARNLAMVATGPAACVAFIRADSPGATHCATAAEAAGIPTTRHHWQAAEAGCAGKRARDPEPVLRSGRSAGRPDSPLLAAALAAAARGWHVLPLRPDDKRPAFPDHDAEHCTGTDPRCRNGHQGWEPRATTDPDRIRRAWSSRPYGIGVACGPSGLLAIDLDQPKPGETPPPFWQREGIHDGGDVFAALAEQTGAGWPETYTVHTGRGGTHLYFTQPAPDPADPDRPPLGNTAGSRGGLGWLIDTRGHGGYVVAAGSAVAGRPYTVAVDLDPAPLPDWLIARLSRPARAAAPRPAVVALAAGRLPAYLRAAVAAEVARVASATEGSRNHTLYVAAVALGQLVAGGALPAELATGELHQAGVGIGLDAAEAAATIRSGMRAGARRPRRPGRAAA